MFTSWIKFWYSYENKNITLKRTCIYTCTGGFQKLNSATDVINILSTGGDVIAMNSIYK